ncbi:MAG: NUDIX hydrolase [Actinomycetota bacterium]|nr:NUDIX hydrolase [Actinomycetota bacterium]
MRLPDGRLVEGYLRLDLLDYVVIVALADAGVIVLHSYKHGPADVVTSLPAGYLEPSEEPAEAARRELLEETGHVAEDWEELGTFIVDGNRGAGTVHMFLARGARVIAAPGAGDLEETEMSFLPLDELVAALQGGAIPVLPMAAAVALAALRLSPRA